MSSSSGDIEKFIINDDHIIRVSKGPQFRAKGGIFLAMLFVCTLWLSIVGFAHEKFLLAILFIIVCIALLSLVLDIHGIEVNRNIHKIRDYKVFLWFRTGEWQDLKNFKSIHVVHENVVTRSSIYSGSKSDTYHYYKIKLADELNKKEIYLAEYKNYYKAQRISQNIADATGIEFKDFVKGSIKRK